jgi:hypothetical protein
MNYRNLKVIWTSTGLLTEVFMNKIKLFAQKMMSNALFWIFSIFASLVGFIAVFERFAQFSVDKIYMLF